MKTIVDENGNERVVVEPGAITAPADKPTKAKGSRITDVTIAQMAIEQWGKPLAYQAGQFWSYDSERGWEVCTNQFNVLCNDLRGGNTEGSVMKIVAAMRAIPDVAFAQTPATYWELIEGQWLPFEVTSKQVLFSNGLLDLESMVFTPTEYRVIYGPRISLPFDPEVGFDLHCEQFEKLVEYALPELDVRNYFQGLCSLVLQPHVVFRGQIVFVGVPHSGKSTLATAIACAPGGSQGQSAVPEDRLTRDKWASNMLVNKFVNVSHDSEHTAKWEAWMKGYTTGTFVAEPKFSKPTTLTATAKLFATCNEFQPTTDLSGAALGRYQVFKFLNPINRDGSHDQGQYMTPAYWSHPDRRAGIISWLLNGLVRVLDEGLHEPQSMEDVKRDVVYESNEVMHFIATCIEQAPGEFLPSADIAAAVGGSVHGIGKMIPKFVERVWHAKKARRDGVRGFEGIRLIK